MAGPAPQQRILSDFFLEGLKEAADNWEMSAPLEDIESFRAGQMSANDLLGSVASELNERGFGLDDMIRYFTFAGDFGEKTNDFIQSPEFIGQIRDAINSGVNVGRQAAATALQNVRGIKKQEKEFFVNSIIPAIARNLKGVPIVGQAAQAASTLNMVASSFRYLARAMPENSMFAGAVGGIAKHLTSALSNPNMVIAGTVASGLYTYSDQIKNWWNGLNSEQKEDASPLTKKLIDANEELRRRIIQGDIKEKDSQALHALGSALKGRMSPEQRAVVQKEYDDNVLSVLARQLGQVLQDTLPLSEFSSFELKKRAVKPIGGRESQQLAGYPSSVIGIH